MDSNQESFIFGVNPPKSEEHHYLKQIKNEKINIVFADEENNKKNIPFSPETTIQEAIREFIRKFKPNDNIENYDFQVDGGRLNINSKEKVGKKFLNNSIITVLEIKGLIAA